MNSRIGITDYGWWVVEPVQPLELEAAWGLLAAMGNGLSTQVVMTLAREQGKYIYRYIVPPEYGEDVAREIQEALRDNID